MTTNNEVDSTKEVILIDLDVLLDTRLAALIATDIDWTNAVLDDGSYHARDTDVWNNIRPGLNVEIYNEIYQNRDVELLKAARLTNFMINLLNITKYYELDLATRSDMVSDVIIVVNTFPYDLTQAVEYNLLEAMKQYLGTVVEIKLTRQCPMELTMRNLVRLGYTQYVTYEFAKWCEFHFKDEKHNTTMAGKFNFAIVAPALLNSSFNDDVKQKLIENQLEDENPFEITKVVFAAIMDLSFLPPGDFSLLQTSKLETGTTPVSS